MHSMALWRQCLECKVGISTKREERTNRALGLLSWQAQTHAISPFHSTKSPL